MSLAASANHVLSTASGSQFLIQTWGILTEAFLLVPQLQIRWETNVRNGVCGLSFDRKDIEMNKFAVTCLEAQFHVFDARTQHPKKVSGKFLGAGISGQGQVRRQGCLQFHMLLASDAGSDA